MMQNFKRTLSRKDKKKKKKEERSVDDDQETNAEKIEALSDEKQYDRLLHPRQKRVFALE